MRRKDRELSAQEGLEIIDASEYGVISCVTDEGEIFSVPISIVRDGGSVFLHGARGGSKAKLLKEGKDATLVCVTSVKVPKFSDEYIDQMVRENKAASLFTTEYKSAVAKVKVHEITDEADKIHALEILSRKYTPAYMRAFDAAVAQSLKITKIYELKIQSVTAKAKIIRD